MERKLVSIRKIKELRPIEGADLIELAIVDGWQCVVKKGEFIVGDLGIYFEIDSFLPLIPEFDFLAKSGTKTMNGEKGIRLKTIRLRGQLSQGLILPYEHLKRFFIDNPYNVEIPHFQLGNDVTDVIGVKKYEAPIPTQLAGEIVGMFPSFIQKSNQERCLSSKTIIITKNGKKTIEDICNSSKQEEVLSFNHLTKKNEWKKISNKKISNNKNNWIKITLKDGNSIIVTKDHKIYIDILKKYIEAQNLNINDKLQIIKNFNV